MLLHFIEKQTGPEGHGQGHLASKWQNVNPGLSDSKHSGPAFLLDKDISVDLTNPLSLPSLSSCPRRQISSGRGRVAAGTPDNHLGDWPEAKMGLEREDQALRAQPDSLPPAPMPPGENR